HATSHRRPAYWTGKSLLLGTADHVIDPNPMIIAEQSTEELFPVKKADHPVVYVSWRDAITYCEWLTDQLRQGVNIANIPDEAFLLVSQGKMSIRLLTEVEWEKAASWEPVRSQKRVYPWGNDFDYRKCNTKESGIGDTTPIGQYSNAIG